MTCNDNDIHTQYRYIISILVGGMAGRGCSSKEKLYREHCEVHEMDGLIERFCYCSFNLCNTANNLDKVTNYFQSQNSKIQRNFFSEIFVQPYGVLHHSEWCSEFLTDF